jgi:uncharacterized membrane protein
MKKDILSIHRFLADQSFYALLLVSLYSLVLWVGRILVAGSWSGRTDFIWNLFLAWVPFLLSIYTAALNNLLPRQWWLLLPGSLIWLLFFPNAAYLITDILNIDLNAAPIEIWYDVMLVIAFSLAGLFLTVASLRCMQRVIHNLLGDALSWLFVLIVLGLTSIGLYLGRFLRLNTWDLFSQPTRILHDSSYPFASPQNLLQFVLVTALYSLLLLVSYLTFISLGRPAQIKQD